MPDRAALATHDATPRTRPPATTLSRSLKALLDNQAALTVTCDRKAHNFVPASQAFTTACSGRVEGDTSSVLDSDTRDDAPARFQLGDVTGKVVRLTTAPSRRFA